MIISISGAQCTGKTTLINALKEIPELRENVLFMGSPSRKGNDQGIRINNEATILDQLWIYTAYMKEFIEACLSNHKHIISDRCLLDVLSYTVNCANRCTDAKMKTRWTIAKDIIMKSMFSLSEYYDYFVVLKPEFDIVDDGVRSADRLYQKEIAGIFNVTSRILSEHIPEKVILDVTGSVDNRVKRILELLDIK